MGDSQDWLDTVWEIAASIWDRVVLVWQSTSSAPATSTWVAAGIVTVLLLTLFWRAARHWMTLVHETGHAVFFVVTGGSLHGIRMHADSSGLATGTVPSGFAGVVSSAAGYPAPAWLGGGLLVAIELGRVGIPVVIGAALALILLPFARTWLAVVALAATAAALSVAIWFWTEQSTSGPGWIAAVVVLTLALFSYLGSLRDLAEELQVRRGGGFTDLVAMSQQSRLPAGVWWFVLLMLSASAVMPTMLVLQ